MATAKKPLTAEAVENESGLVPVTLFKDSGRYKDDVFVCDNGKGYKIQRGKTVMVPPSVKEILDQSEAQDRKTADMIEALEREYLESDQ